MALAACARDRSFEDLQRAEEALERASEEQKILFLPVFFIGLDPGLIPTAEELETLHFGTRQRLGCAVLSMNGIFSIFRTPPSSDLGPTLWPPIFSWAFFIHIHRDHLPAVSMMPHAGFYSHFMIFSARFHDRPSQHMLTLMSSTPGFRVLLAQAWVVLPQVKEEGPLCTFGACLHYLCFFIGALDFTDPVHFAEIIEGAGGSLDDVAQLVVACTEEVYGDESSCENSRLYCILGLLDFLHHLVCPHRPIPEPAVPVVEKFLDSLRDCKFLPTLVLKTSSLHDWTSEDVTPALGLSLELLQTLLDTPGGYRWLPDTIEAGLLRLIATLTCTQFGPPLESHLRYFLTNILHDGLVHYDVVRVLPDAFRDAAEICSGQEFEASKIFENWSTLSNVARDRIEVVRRLHNHELGFSKACDNVEVRGFTPMHLLNT